MSADTSDSALHRAVAAVHNAHEPTKWLVATYAAPASAALVLRATGNEPALAGLRGALEAQEDTAFGYAEVLGRGLVVLSLANGVGGVKRAKAIVHSRAFAALFPDYLALVTITRHGELTDELVAERLGLPSLPPAPPSSTPKAAPVKTTPSPSASPAESSRSSLPSNTYPSNPSSSSNYAPSSHMRSASLAPSLAPSVTSSQTQRAPSRTHTREPSSASAISTSAVSTSAVGGGQSSLHARRPSDGSAPTSRSASGGYGSSIPSPKDRDRALPDLPTSPEAADINVLEAALPVPGYELPPRPMLDTANQALRRATDSSAPESPASSNTTFHTPTYTPSHSTNSSVSANSQSSASVAQTPRQPASSPLPEVAPPIPPLQLAGGLPPIPERAAARGSPPLDLHTGHGDTPKPSSLGAGGAAAASAAAGAGAASLSIAVNKDRTVSSSATSPRDSEASYHTASGRDGALISPGMQSKDSQSFYTASRDSHISGRDSRISGISGVSGISGRDSGRDSTPSMASTDWRNSRDSYGAPLSSIRNESRRSSHASSRHGSEAAGSTSGNYRSPLMASPGPPRRISRDSIIRPPGVGKLSNRSSREALRTSQTPRRMSRTSSTDSQPGHIMPPNLLAPVAAVPSVPARSGARNRLSSNNMRYPPPPTSPAPDVPLPPLPPNARERTFSAGAAALRERERRGSLGRSLDPNISLEDTMPRSRSAYPKLDYGLEHDLPPLPPMPDGYLVDESPDPGQHRSPKSREMFPDPPPVPKMVPPPRSSSRDPAPPRVKSPETMTVPDVVDINATPRAAEVAVMPETVMPSPQSEEVATVPASLPVSTPHAAMTPPSRIPRKAPPPVTIPPVAARAVSSRETSPTVTTRATTPGATTPTGNSPGLISHSRVPSLNSPTRKKPVPPVDPDLLDHPELLQIAPPPGSSLAKNSESAADIEAEAAEEEARETARQDKERAREAMESIGKGHPSAAPIAAGVAAGSAAGATIGLGISGSALEPPLTPTGHGPSGVSAVTPLFSSGDESISAVTPAFSTDGTLAATAMPSPRPSTHSANTVKVSTPRSFDAALDAPALPISSARSIHDPPSPHTPLPDQEHLGDDASSLMYSPRSPEVDGGEMLDDVQTVKASVVRVHSRSASAQFVEISNGHVRAASVDLDRAVEKATEVNKPAPVPPKSAARSIAGAGGSNKGSPEVGTSPMMQVVNIPAGSPLIGTDLERTSSRDAEQAQRHEQRLSAKPIYVDLNEDGASDMAHGGGSSVGHGTTSSNRTSIGFGLGSTLERGLSQSSDRMKRRLPFRRSNGSASTESSPSLTLNMHQAGYGSPGTSEFPNTPPSPTTARLRTASITRVFRRKNSLPPISGNPSSPEASSSPELAGLGIGLGPSAYRTATGGIGYSPPTGRRGSDVQASITAEAALLHARNKGLAEQNAAHERWRQNEAARRARKTSEASSGGLSLSESTRRFHGRRSGPNSIGDHGMLAPDSRLSMAMSGDTHTSRNSILSGESDLGLAYDDPEVSELTIATRQHARAPSVDGNIVSPVDQLNAAASAARRNRRAGTRDGSEFEDGVERMSPQTHDSPYLSSGNGSALASPHTDRSVRSTLGNSPLGENVVVLDKSPLVMSSEFPAHGSTSDHSLPRSVVKSVRSGAATPSEEAERSASRAAAERKAEAERAVAERKAEAEHQALLASDSEAAAAARAEVEQRRAAQLLAVERAEAERREVERLEAEKVAAEKRAAAEVAAAKRAEEDRVRKEQEEQRKEREKERAEVEKEKREAMREQLVKGKSDGGVMLRGWVTVQTTQSLTWRRRYFHLVGAELLMFKNDSDSKPITTVQLGKGAKVDQAYEESQVRGSWSLRAAGGEEYYMFADSAEDKDLILEGLAIAIAA